MGDHIMKMGKNMEHALAFIRKYNGWHSYASDRATVYAVWRLKERGLVEINQHQQFRAK